MCLKIFALFERHIMATKTNFQYASGQRVTSSKKIGETALRLYTVNFG